MPLNIISAEAGTIAFPNALRLCDQSESPSSVPNPRGAKSSDRANSSAIRQPCQRHHHDNFHNRSKSAWATSHALARRCGAPISAADILKHTLAYPATKGEHGRRTDRRDPVIVKGLRDDEQANARRQREPKREQDVMVLAARSDTGRSGAAGCRICRSRLRSEFLRRHEGLSKTVSGRVSSPGILSGMIDGGCELTALTQASCLKNTGSPSKTQTRLV